MLHTSLLVMNRVNKTEFAIFISFDVVLASKRSNLLELIKTVAIATVLAKLYQIHVPHDILNIFYPSPSHVRRYKP